MDCSHKNLSYYCLAADSDCEATLNIFSRFCFQIHAIRLRAPRQIFESLNFTFKTFTHPDFQIAELQMSTLLNLQHYAQLDIQLALASDSTHSTARKARPQKTHEAYNARAAEFEAWCGIKGFEAMTRLVG